MKQPNLSNPSGSQLVGDLERTLNKRENGYIIYSMYKKYLFDQYERGLVTIDEYNQDSTKTFLVKDYLFKKFVEARLEITNQPLEFISDEELLAMLTTGSYTYEELEEINLEREDIVTEETKEEDPYEEMQAYLDARWESYLESFSN